MGPVRHVEEEYDPVLLTDFIRQLPPDERAEMMRRRVQAVAEMEAEDARMAQLVEELEKIQQEANTIFGPDSPSPNAKCSRQDTMAGHDDLEEDASSNSASIPGVIDYEYPSESESRLEEGDSESTQQIDDESIMDQAASTSALTADEVQGRSVECTVDVNDVHIYTLEELKADTEEVDYVSELRKSTKFNDSATEVDNAHGYGGGSTTTTQIEDRDVGGGTHFAELDDHIYRQFDGYADESQSTPTQQSRRKHFHITGVKRETATSTLDQASHDLSASANKSADEGSLSRSPQQQLEEAPGSVYDQHTQDVAQPIEPWSDSDAYDDVETPKLRRHPSTPVLSQPAATFNSPIERSRVLPAWYSRSPSQQKSSTPAVIKRDADTYSVAKRVSPAKPYAPVSRESPTPTAHSNNRSGMSSSAWHTSQDHVGRALTAARYYKQLPQQNLASIHESYTTLQNDYATLQKKYAGLKKEHSLVRDREEAERKRITELLEVVNGLEDVVGRLKEENHVLKRQLKNRDDRTRTAAAPYIERHSDSASGVERVRAAVSEIAPAREQERERVRASSSRVVYAPSPMAQAVHRERIRVVKHR
ncbi:hypothetical protein BC832DRAFT_590196 [Gaertneriomyces semiglobifer]|nr:hypothetical protein BC832DRAFT_590196 [Gaertneriomyces semiglobifer]